MSENYIQKHFGSIKKHARLIENRIDDEWCTMESVLEENTRFLEGRKNMMQTSYGLMRVTR